MHNTAYYAELLLLIQKKPNDVYFETCFCSQNIFKKLLDHFFADDDDG